MDFSPMIKFYASLAWRYMHFFLGSRIINGELRLREDNMSSFFLKVLAVFFPWAALFICNNPGGALVALVMQVTIFGWPFAAAWALKAVNEEFLEDMEERRLEKKQQKRAKKQGVKVDE